jgi:hypothetical protein
MEDKLFFKYYLPALELSLACENNLVDFSVNGPDWFIEDDVIRNEIDLFEQNNFEKYHSFFQMIANYLDARAHNFETIDNMNLHQVKEKIANEILFYKSKYDLD